MDTDRRLVSVAFRGLELAPWGICKGYSANGPETRGHIVHCASRLNYCVEYISKRPRYPGCTQQCPFQRFNAAESESSEMQMAGLRRTLSFSESIEPAADTR